MNQIPSLFSSLPHVYQVKEEVASHVEGSLKGTLKSRLSVIGYRGEIVKIAVERLANSGLQALFNDMIYFFKNLLCKRFVIINSGNERLAINIRSCVERLSLSREEVLALETTDAQTFNLDTWLVEQTIKKDGMPALFGSRDFESIRFASEVIDSLIQRIVCSQSLDPFTEETFSRFYYVLFEEFASLEANSSDYLKSDISSLKEIFKTDHKAFEKAVALLLLDCYGDYDECPVELLQKAEVNHQSNSFQVITQFAKIGMCLPTTNIRYHYIGITPQIIEKGQQAIFKNLVLNILRGIESKTFSLESDKTLIEAMKVPQDVISKGLNEVLRWVLVDSFKEGAPLSFEVFKNSIYAPLDLVKLWEDQTNSQESFEAKVALELIKYYAENAIILDYQEHINLYQKAGIQTDDMLLEKKEIIKAILKDPRLQESYESPAVFIRTFEGLFKLLGVDERLLFRCGIFADEILKSLT